MDLPPVEVLRPQERRIDPRLTKYLDPTGSGMPIMREGADGNL